MRNFDKDTIKVITMFENITGTEVKDCICSESIYFLVSPGKIGITIGKNGQTIRTAERMLKKTIRVFKWSDNAEELIKNMIPTCHKIEIDGESAVISVETKNKGSVIGKDGSNIKIVREFLTRNSEIKELKVL